MVSGENRGSLAEVASVPYRLSLAFWREEARGLQVIFGLDWTMSIEADAQTSLYPVHGALPEVLRPPDSQYS